MNLSRHGKVSRVLISQAAGTGTLNSSIVDMQGYDSVTFIVGFGTITSTGVQSVKGQQGAASDLSDAADLAGTSISVADTDDDDCVILEIDQPRERYVRATISRATANSEVDFIIAIQTKAKTEPVTHDATVVGAEYHLAPAEGTA